jgi:hypothetical protein
MKGKEGGLQRRGREESRRGFVFVCFWFLFFPPIDLRDQQGHQKEARNNE